jgi:hypothetical protein
MAAPAGITGLASVVVPVPDQERALTFYLVVCLKFG